MVGSQTSTAPSLYQCQPSSANNGQVFFPNIPDFYFNGTNAASFRDGSGANLTITGQSGATYVFTVPEQSAERNCSGTVVSFQYCYQARNGDIGQTRDVFALIALTRNGLQFNVTARMRVQTTPQNSILCTDRPGRMQKICCTTRNLSPSEQLQVPVSNFTFGVVNTNNNTRILHFRNQITDYDVERFWIRQQGSNGPMPGDILSPGSSFVQQFDRSLLILRFFIGKLFYSRHAYSIYI